MSAPDTNLEKQKSRHRGPLLGLAICIATATLLFLGYLTVMAERGQTPNDTGAQIDGRTGAVIPAEG